MVTLGSSGMFPLSSRLSNPMGETGCSRQVSVGNQLSQSTLAWGSMALNEFLESTRGSKRLLCLEMLLPRCPDFSVTAREYLHAEKMPGTSGHRG